MTQRKRQRNRNTSNVVDSRRWADTDEKRAYLDGLQPTYLALMFGENQKGIPNVPQRNWLREKCDEYRDKFGQEIGKGDTPAAAATSGRKVSVIHFTQAIED